MKGYHFLACFADGYQGNVSSRLTDAYSFEGFRARATVRGVFGKPKVRIVTLVRRSKKHSVESAARCIAAGATRSCGKFGIFPVGDTHVRGELEVRRVDCRQCGKVKRERLEFLADNPFYTKRLAFYVGRRCRTSTIKAVADELDLDWQTVKELDKQYMGAQLARAGTPEPDGSAGTDRSEASMDEFFKWLGPRKTQGVRLAVMDMWKPFGNSRRKHAPQATFLFDKFHVMRHLGEALDR